MEKGNFCISTMALLNLKVLLSVAFITIVVIRIYYVICWRSKLLHFKSPRSFSTLIVLGSGGHTADMLNLLDVLQNERFNSRYYIAAATDDMSLQKAHTFEESLVCKEAIGVAEFMQIYRSQEVGQSFISSVGNHIDRNCTCMVVNDQDQTSSALQESRSCL